MESNQREAPLPADAPGAAQLSERELEILRLVATGAGNKQIAQQLVISPNTVKVHLRNIFGKIGVATRTEATLYAIREGLVKVASGTLPAAEVDATVAIAAVLEGDDGNSGTTEVTPALVGRPTKRPGTIAWLVGGLAVIAIVLLGYLLLQRQPGKSAAAGISPTAVLPRWEKLADLPTARSGLAVATYGNQVYVTGGDTPNGVIGITQRYDPATNTWANLAPKPLPVTDVQAAVIGGLMYVPGGRGADGKIADNLEVFDPRQDQWEQRAHMPKALSGYALVAFEGRLLLFGGWDGAAYQAGAFAYSPDQDAWLPLTSMPAPRAFAGAAVASGKVYVIGGLNQSGALSRNDEYAPENEGTGVNPWRARAALPETRYDMGVVGLADIIHLVGGVGDSPDLAALKYFPQADRWEAFALPPTQQLTGLGLIAVDTNLHILGGRQTTQTAPVPQHLTYQAIFTLEIPIVH